MKSIGKYELLKKLGSGATSTVYLAQDQFNNQQVALKLFNPASMLDSENINAYHKLLVTEASLAGKLSHPHIVKIFDAVLEGELNYMVMEYVQGDTLEKYTKSNQLLPFSEVAEIIYKCAKALEYAQQQGVIHRDIKPANIMLTYDGAVKITDFGSALIENNHISQQLTQVTGVGSPSYMSPEQIQELPLTHQTDIYSLGVTMFALLTGKLPFHADSSYGLLYQIMNSTPPQLRKFRPEISEQLEKIVLRAMHRDALLRYATWKEFCRDLVDFVTAHSEEEEDISDTEKFDKMRGLHFFQNVGDIELWEVLRISQWREVSKGQKILHEGDECFTFFIIAAGEMNITRQGYVLDTLQQGDCFGEMKNYADRHVLRTTGVEAASEATLIGIDLAALALASVECRFQLDDAFLYILLSRLNKANVRIARLLSSQWADTSKKR